MKRNYAAKRMGILLSAVMLAAFTACGSGNGVSEEQNDTENTTVEESDKESTDMVDEVGETPGGEADEETNAEPVQIKLLVEEKSHSDMTDDDTYTSLYSGSYDLIYLTDDCKSAYPELSKSLDEFNAQIESGFLEDYKQYLSYAKEQYNEMEDKDYFYGYSDNYDISACRADDTFLSLSVGYSDYMGGAHGSYGNMGYNYDVKTGKELTLKDVVTDITAFQNVVKEKLIAEYGEDFFGLVDSLDEAMSEYLTGEKDQTCSWNITSRGVKITFGLYVLASYAQGTQTVDVYYDENPELFADIFKVQTGDYIESYSYNGSFKIDIGGDGTPDDVSIEPQYTEYGEVESVDISVNGLKSSMEVYGYNITPRFIHKGVNTFLYLEMTSDNDYRNTYAFRLEEGGVIKVSEYYGYLTEPVPQSDFDGDWSIYRYPLLTTPNELYFGTRMQILSTHEGIAKALINDKGEMELPDNYYYSQFYDDFGKLTAKQDIKAGIVAEDTHEVIEENAVIPAGTVVKILGTDGEKIVDLKDDSGTVYRVTINQDEWPQTIDGTDIEELFDGIMFAG